MKIDYSPSAHMMLSLLMQDPHVFSSIFLEGSPGIPVA